jgi:hypothetical protein
MSTFKKSELKKIEPINGWWNEELNVQLKLVLELISRSKQKKPHLEKQFIAKKQLLIELIQYSNHLNKANQQPVS